VWRAYGAAYYAIEREHATAGHLGIMERMIGSARARYESGSGRLDEVLRAEAEYARALADLAAYRGEVRRARARLDAWRGRGAAEAMPESLAAPPAPELPGSPAPWLAAVAEGHPELDAFDARARGERLAAQAARRRVWPDLAVSFDWGFRETLVTVGPDGGVPANTVRMTPQEDMWSLKAAVELPIFAGADQYAEGRAREAMADAAEAERSAAALSIEAGIVAAHAEAIEASRTASLLADTVVVTYRRALAASSSAYAAGTADLWRTLEAAHQLYEQEIALSRAREMRVAAIARFIELTGRGDLIGVPLPVLPEGEDER
jgi:outer membrane protein TolC